jgi:predicted transcriptional regulator
MRTLVRSVVGAVLVTLVAAPAVALDCARVKTLHEEGKRASEIARELGITTPDVQACLADQVEEPAPTGVRHAPLGFPSGVDELPREPNR